MTAQLLRPATLLVALALLIGSTVATPPTTQRLDKKVITMKNTTKFAIKELYISPDNEDHWGENLLDDKYGPLKPGDEQDVEVDCGKWDVKVVVNDKLTCEIEDVTLCEAKQWDIVTDCK